MINTTLYKYDQNNNMIDKIEMEQLAETDPVRVVHRLLTEYDDSNRVIKESIFGKENTMDKENRYSYKDGEKYMITYNFPGQPTWNRTLYLSRGGYQFRTPEEAKACDKQCDEREEACKTTKDENGNITRIEYPEGGIMETTFNEFNKPLTVTVNGELRTVYTYDERGNEISWTVDGLDCTQEYNEKNQMIKSFPDDKSWVTVYEYDERGNLIKEETIETK